MSMRRPSRRAFLKGTLVGLPTVAAATAGGMGWYWSAADVSTVGQVRFDRPLAIPPLAGSRPGPAGSRVFELRAAVGRRQFKPGPATTTWGLDGDYLGPTLRAARGETVLVHVRNELPETTTLHWHGMHLPARMDGGPHQPIEPRATWSPTWRIDQPAASLWYHPHPHGRTRRHVTRGLAGMFILDDPETGDLPLPGRYGVDDIPVIVQDHTFDRDNQFDEGNLGDTILVNGTLGPYLDVVTERVRLRLLNASNGRVYRFGLTGDRPFALIGTDGGLLAEPHQTDRIQLSPGERAEIVVTMRPGERLVLRSHPPELALNFWMDRFTGGDDTFDVLELRAAAALAASPELPRTLTKPPDVDPTAAVATRAFELSGSELNGRKMDMNRIDVAVTRDTTEIWEVTNGGDNMHNFHVHDVRFQVLSVGGEPPGPELRGWKDTVFAPPRTPVRLAIRFGGYTDPRTPYMIHCHHLRHEDRGLMGQYVVVAPGQPPAPSTGHAHG